MAETAGVAEAAGVAKTTVVPEAAKKAAPGGGLQQRSFAEFVQHELVHFSLADTRRSLPSLVDGLKPSQRKVLHGAAC